MSTFYRYDLWVKTAQGPAVPGAQIYVCTQPANTSTVPPSPLAAIYSDSGGLVPITQPIITDGFGHADFYALPGLYTVVVAFSGQIQQVYPDQSLGAIGTTGGGGGGTSGSLLLQVNGVTASSQLVQNLTAGTSISLTDLGGGQIKITNTSPGTVFNNPGGAYFVGPGLSNSAFINNFNAQITNLGAHVVLVELFVLQASWTLSACTYTVMSTGSGTFNHGIYSAAGNKLIDCNFNGTISTTQTIPISPAVTLPPGVYYFASSCSVATGSSPFGPHSQWTAGEITANLNSLNSGTRVMIGTAANAESGGVLPATLGTLTPVVSSPAAYQGSAIPIWQV